MADVTLLRTLTRKSKLKYGKGFDQTVSEMLIRDKMRLASDYFHLSAITFTDDVLDEIGIPAEMRIPKPGKMPYREAQAAWYKCCQLKKAELKESIGEIAYMNLRNARKKDAKIILWASEKVIRPNRGKLARRNHGHGG